MAKFPLANRAVGDEVTFANGAVARVVQARRKDGSTYKRLQIVRGGTPPTGAQRRRRSISPKAAQRAFTSYWKKRYAAAASPKNKRGVKSAWARDLVYGTPARKRTTTTYKLNPGYYEYPGVDLGAKRYKKATGARAAALARGRAALAARRR